MQKSVRILIIVLLSLLAAAAVVFFTPKTFGKHADLSKVDHINVFDGRTGFGFTIDDPEEVSHIVENIRSHPMKRVGISLGAVGYGLKISYVDAEDHAVIPLFLLNSDDTIRKDPFFYQCGGGLCFDYIREIENRFAN